MICFYSNLEPFSSEHEFRVNLCVVVSGIGLINIVNRHWARLLLGWVTDRGYVTSHLGRLRLLPSVGW